MEFYTLRMCDPCQWHHHRIGRLWCPPGAVGRLLMTFGWKWFTPIFIALESSPFYLSTCFLGYCIYFPYVCCVCLPCLPVLCPCCSLFPLLSWFNLLLFILFSSLFLLCLVGLLVFFFCHHLFVVAGCVLFLGGKEIPQPKFKSQRLQVSQVDSEKKTHQKYLM